jgi:hypothetical protein
LFKKIDTGNESPVEEYVNNTGLMWELGIELDALLVFVEHRYLKTLYNHQLVVERRTVSRYEGKSIPDLIGMEDCAAVN